MQYLECHVLKLLFFADAGGCVFKALPETRGRKGGGIWRVIEYRKFCKKKLILLQYCQGVKSIISAIFKEKVTFV